jgi:hypothetical protein
MTERAYGAVAEPVVLKVFLSHFSRYTVRIWGVTIDFLTIDGLHTWGGSYFDLCYRVVGGTPETSFLACSLGHLNGEGTHIHVDTDASWNRDRRLEHMVYRAFDAYG